MNDKIEVVIVSNRKYVSKEVYTNESIIAPKMAVYEVGGKNIINKAKIQNVCRNAEIKWFMSYNAHKYTNNNITHYTTTMRAARCQVFRIDLKVKDGLWSKNRFLD